MMEKLTSDQKHMIERAIRVHDEGVEFAREMQRRYGVSVSAGSGILAEQIAIIVFHQK
jgi:hypothetical protein